MDGVTAPDAAEVKRLALLLRVLRRPVTRYDADVALLSEYAMAAADHIDAQAAAAQALRDEVVRLTEQLAEARLYQQRNTKARVEAESQLAAERAAVQSVLDRWTGKDTK